MAVYNIIPVSPIHEIDVRDTLNANGSSVNDTWASLCGNPNNNGNSKHKPVRLNVNFCQDHNPSGANYVKDWWKAIDGLCGFKLDKAKASGWSTLVTLYDGGQNGWIYQPPQGGTAQPYRITDFAGYYPAARPLSHGFSAPATVYKTQISASAAMALPIESEHSLTWRDFDTLKNYYFGILLWRSASDYRRVTASETLANDGATVTFNPSLLTSGATYTVYPFICSVPYTSESANDKAMTIYTVPNVEPSLMEVKSSAVIILPLAQKVNATKTIEWSVKVTNSTASAITLSNNSVRIYRGAGISTQTGDYSATIANTTVAAGATSIIGQGTAKVGYDRSDPSFDFANARLKISVSLQNGTYTATAQVANDITIEETIAVAIL
jgi:hypothetical protein